MSIALLATIPAQKGKRAELEKLFVKMRADVLKHEKGCSYYEIFTSRENPDAVVLVEVYDSQADWDAHNASQHMKELVPVLTPLLGGKPDVKVVDHI